MHFGRKVGEGFVIGGNVKVTITEVKGKRVRVMIDAPRDVDVFRTEIQDRIDNGMAKSVRPEFAPEVPVLPLIPIGGLLPGQLMRSK